MARADVIVHFAAEIVVRESDGRTLVLTECWSTDRDAPLFLSVVEREDD